MNAITVICPTCDGDGIATTNDPSSARRCPVCDGDGIRELPCNDCGDGAAIEWFQSEPLCADCAAHAKENAFVFGEDVVEESVL